MLKPMGEFVVVRRDDAHRKTEGGIHIPDSAQELPRSGVVLAIGPGIRSRETGVLVETVLKPGERVLFSHFVGVSIDAAEDDVLLKESDVLGTLPTEAT